MVERCHRIRKELDDLVLVYQNDPSDVMLAKLKKNMMH
jgi:hypothetical protein